MKRVLLLLITVFISAGIFASTTPSSGIPVFNANKMMIPVGKTGKSISLMDLSVIKRSDLETLTGNKMSFFERMAFNKMQKRLKKGIAVDGTITDKKMLKAMHKRGMDETTGFHGLGFILGFFLGIIGVVLAYVIDENPDKKNRVKWAWIGFGVATILTLALYVILVVAITANM